MKATRAATMNHANSPTANPITASPVRRGQTINDSDSIAARLAPKVVVEIGVMPFLESLKSVARSSGRVLWRAALASQRMGIAWTETGTVLTSNVLHTRIVT